MSTRFQNYKTSYSFQNWGVWVIEQGSKLPPYAEKFTHIDSVLALAKAGKEENRSSRL
jgi:hypothetical protein